MLCSDFERAHTAIGVCGLDDAWHWYLANASTINPIGTFAAALGAFGTAAVLAWAGVRNALTAARRDAGQTKADLQRRITESFSKAAEQLASEKIEARLSGIYTLERIARESPDDYWTAMENITAFVRERSRKTETQQTSPAFLKWVSDRAYFLWLEAGQPEDRADSFWVKAVMNSRNRRRQILLPPYL